ncbi:MAG: flagellar hook-length control protein FliK [Proteobacteria bacterium]|nr:flagellar hook-length control protein FliK [Pseudomonadota bacterium]
MEKTGISSTPAAQGPHEARGARAATGKAGAARQTEQAGAQGAGFAQLLADLGDDGGGDLLAGLGSDAAALVDMGGAAPPTLADPPDAAALAAWMAALQPGCALAQAGSVALTATKHDAVTGGGMGVMAGMTGGAMLGEPDALMSRVGLGLVRQGQESLVGQTALLDGQAEAAALGGAPQPLGARPGVARALPAQGAADAGAGAGHAAPRAGLAAVHKRLETEAVQAQPAVQAAGATPVERHDAGVAPAAVLPRPAAEPVLPGAVMTTAAAAGDLAPTAGRAGDSAAAGTTGTPVVHPHGPEAQDAAPAPADAAQSGMASAEDQLAEQVAYWVHHKTQNAELTLDSDGRPVEVKVSLTGDAAHVSFRSDQAEARQLLDASSAELRAMLQREGLQLAGVSVGAAGGEGAPARQGAREGGRPPLRQATVQAAAPAGRAARRALGLGEKSVDIFV